MLQSNQKILTPLRALDELRRMLNCRVKAVQENSASLPQVLFGKALLIEFFKLGKFTQEKFWVYCLRLDDLRELLVLGLQPVLLLLLGEP